MLDSWKKKLLYTEWHNSLSRYPHTLLWCLPGSVLTPLWCFQLVSVKCACRQSPPSQDTILASRPTTANHYSFAVLHSWHIGIFHCQSTRRLPCLPPGKAIYSAWHVYKLRNIFTTACHIEYFFSFRLRFQQLWLIRKPQRLNTSISERLNRGTSHWLHWNTYFSSCTSVCVLPVL